MLRDLKPIASVGGQSISPDAWGTAHPPRGLPAGAGGAATPHAADQNPDDAARLQAQLNDIQTKQATQTVAEQSANDLVDLTYQSELASQNGVTVTDGRRRRAGNQGRLPARAAPRARDHGRPDRAGDDRHGHRGGSADRLRQRAEGGRGARRRGSRSTRSPSSTARTTARTKAATWAGSMPPTRPTRPGTTRSFASLPAA